MAKGKRSKKNIISGNINPHNQALLDKYIRFMTIKELSETTIKNYKYELESWFRYLNSQQFDILVEDVTQDEIEEYIYDQKKAGNNFNRIKFKFSTLSAFFIFLKKKKIIKENPVEDIDRPKKGDTVVEQTYLTLEQVLDLKNKLKENGDLQLEVFVNLALCTMARVNAISNIMWKNIDFENNMIKDVVEKEQRTVTLFIDDYTKELLQELRRYRRREDIRNPYVLITRYNDKWNKVSNATLNSWTKIAGSLINEPQLHNHDWRHSMATILRDSGMPLEDISKCLNHLSTDVTLKHYIQQDSKKLQASLSKFNPFDKK